MAMTSDDWKTVEERLKHFYQTVTLDCDGYRLMLQLARVDTYHNAICLYVNGWLQGEWITNDCEERRRFFRPCKRFLYKPKERAALMKIKKTVRKSMKIDPGANFTCYWPQWTNFDALRRHLIKNNSEITLIGDDRKEVA